MRRKIYNLLKITGKINYNIWKTENDLEYIEIFYVETIQFSLSQLSSFKFRRWIVFSEDIFISLVNFYELKTMLNY